MNGVTAATCTDYDRDNLVRYADCRDALPVCAAGHEQDFLDAVNACDLFGILNVGYKCWNGMH